ELGLPALLGADAREGARRVDQADDRQPKLCRQAHALECLAIALGMGAAVHALAALCERVALLLADEHDAKVAQPGETRADGAVVPEGTVAVQFDELLEDQVEVIERLRTIRVPGHLDCLPGRQIAVDLSLEVDQFPTNAAHLLAAPDLAAGAGLQARKEF